MAINRLEGGTRQAKRYFAGSLSNDMVRTEVAVHPDLDRTLMGMFDRRHAPGIGWFGIAEKRALRYVEFQDDLMIFFRVAGGIQDGYFGEQRFLAAASTRHREQEKTKTNQHEQKEVGAGHHRMVVAISHD